MLKSSAEIKNPDGDVDDFLRECIFRVIDSINENKDYRHWNSKPDVLQRLFVVEVHLERKKSGIEAHKQKLKELENVVLNLEQDLERRDSISYKNEKDQSKYTLGERPHKELKIMEAKTELRVCEGLVTQYYCRDKLAFHHFLYLIQLNERGDPILIASIDPQTYTWRNSYEMHMGETGLEKDDIVPEMFFMVDEKTLAISNYSDENDYFFKIFDKIEERTDSKKRKNYEGKTSFLPTYGIEYTVDKNFQIIGYKLPSEPPLIWMGSSLAKEKLLLYKIEQDAHRLKHLEGRIKVLGEKYPKGEDELRNLKQNREYFTFWLNITREAIKLNDHSACIDMAVQHLTNINFSEPIVLEIASGVSKRYWDHVVLPEWDYMIRGWHFDGQLYDNYLSDRKKSGRILKDIDQNRRQKKLLQYSHMDTYNGYRLSTANCKGTVYDLYILQVIGGRLTIFAKLIKPEITNFSNHIPMFHTWKNLPIKIGDELHHSNIRKVIEEYNSFCGLTTSVGTDRWQLDYSFAICRGASDTEGLLYGKTGLLPQLLIHKDISLIPQITTPLTRDQAHDILRKGARNPTIMLKFLKDKQTEDIELSTATNFHYSIHDPRNQIMLSKQRGLDNAIFFLERHLEAHNEAAKDKATTGVDVSSALQKTLSSLRLSA